MLGVLHFLLHNATVDQLEAIRFGQDPVLHHLVVLIDGQSFCDRTHCTPPFLVSLEDRVEVNRYDRFAWGKETIWSQSVPRRACSRSMASNRALKFPLPKLCAPRRWMISKNRVGRSSTGLVKIWSM